MQEITLKELLEAGCHFGHEVRRWHPKADRYIYGERNGIHIIDLAKTKEGLDRAREYVKKLGEAGKVVMFVGTKRQSSQIIKSEAVRVGACYFDKRWVGGFITNWGEIKKTLDKLNRMEEEKAKGEWQKFPKHEQLKLGRERLKLEKFYGGVKKLKELPEALFIADSRNEKTAVNECISSGIPIVAISDTNCDPTKITYPIPANDDGVKSISLIVKTIAGAYFEGKEAGKKMAVTQEKKTQETPPAKVVAEAEKSQDKIKKEKKVKKKADKKKKNKKP